MTDATLHPDRLFPPDPGLRIVSSHVHTDLGCWGTHASFADAARVNSDARALGSPPARRVDCACPARVVATHRQPQDQAHCLVPARADDLARKAYTL